LTLASGMEDGELKLWKLNGKLLRSINAHDGGIQAMHVNAADMTVVTAGKDAAGRSELRVGARSCPPGSCG
jgi:hypothetical protein